MSIITTERLTKILSETQTVISECNSRGVHGSVEVNARLFENVLMELLRHRAAMLQGAENAESRCSNSPVIPDGLNIRAVAALREAVRNQWLNSDEFADRVYWKSMHDIANEIVSAMLPAAPQQEV
ncbi:TPA: hypothetical protein ACNG4B_002166 [Enterobacter cloacae]|uniref:hypothetical protein n=1 Tax=Enterobacter cloacae TaxID=550 RepID=UPI003B24FF14